MSSYIEKFDVIGRIGTRIELAEAVYQRIKEEAKTTSVVEVGISVKNRDSFTGTSKALPISEVSVETLLRLIDERTDYVKLYNLYEDVWELNNWESFIRETPYTFILKRYKKGRKGIYRAFNIKEPSRYIEIDIREPKVGRNQGKPYADNREEIERFFDGVPIEDIKIIFIPLRKNKINRKR